MTTNSTLSRDAAASNPFFSVLSNVADAAGDALGETLRTVAPRYVAQELLDSGRDRLNDPTFQETNAPPRQGQADDVQGGFTPVSGTIFGDSNNTTTNQGPSLNFSGTTAALAVGALGLGILIFVLARR